MGTVTPDPDGSGSALKRRAVRYHYDAQGRVTRESRGTATGTDYTAFTGMTVLEQVDYTYDSGGNVAKRVLSSGGTTYSVQQLSYDNRGRLECTALRMNTAEFSSLPTSACTLDTEGSVGKDRIVKTTYDAASRVTKVQTGYGVTGVEADEVNTTWTANSQVATVADAKNNKTTYTYDGFDRLQWVQYPDPTTAGTSSSTDYEAFGYDAGGNVTIRYLRGYHTDSTKYIAYAYDDLNRLTYKDLQGGEPDVAYSYDLLGRMTEAVDATGHEVEFTFDALGRNTSQVSPLGTVSYTYDAAGRRTRMTYPGSPALTIDYGYLVTGETTTLTENAASTPVTLATFGYDDLGRRTSLTRGNGGATTNYTYDAVSRLTSLEHALDSPKNVTTTFTHNPAGQIASLTRSNDAYAYGGFANVNRSDTINGLNQIATANSVTVQYDARGNLTKVGTGAPLDYTYSSENLLKTAPGGATLAYDPLLRLYQTSKGSVDTRFLYDGLDLIAEYNGSNALQRRYVHGPGMDEPLVWYEGTGGTDRRWVHADERGSVVAHSDGSGAAIGNPNSYDEYGAPGSGNTGRFQYTGQTWLPEIGMYYYKARVYNPTLGRFMQADPIGYEAGMNLYGYAGGDPVNLVDPFGMEDCAVVTGSRIPRCGDDWIKALQDVGVWVERVGAVGSSGGSSGPYGLVVVAEPADNHNEEAPILVTGHPLIAAGISTYLPGSEIVSGLKDTSKDIVVSGRVASLRVVSMKGDGKHEWIVFPTVSRDAIWTEIKLLLGGRENKPREGVWVLRITENSVMTYRSSTQGGGKTLEFRNPYINNKGYIKFRFAY